MVKRKQEGMRKENIGIILTAAMELAFGLFFCALAGYIFSLETDTETHTYGIMGLHFKGKVLAAIFCWLGLVILFFSIRKMIQRMRQNRVS